MAWGPDHERYEMVECAECHCQGWRSFDGTLDTFYESWGCSSGFTGSALGRIHLDISPLVQASPT